MISWLVAIFACFQGILGNFATMESVRVSSDVPAFDFSIYPLCDFKTLTTPSKQTPVPKLAEAFTIKVEGKIGEWGYFDSEGYSEKEGQRGRQCTKEDLWKTGCNTYAYYIAEVAGYSVISSKCNISASKVTDQGVQDASVRAIQVQMWEQCVHDNNLNITWRNRYYYTAPGVSSPSNPRNATPIRFESLQIDGFGAGKMQVYDFMYYYPDVKDKSVFSPPPGVYCPGWIREQPTAPILPDQFSLTMLTVAKKDSAVYTVKLNLDSQRKLASFVTDSTSRARLPSSSVKNRTLYRTTHDYNNDLSFRTPLGTWLLGGAECNVSAVGSVGLNSKRSDSSAVVHLKIARDMLEWKRSTALYMGQRYFNGMLAQVWVSAQRSNNDGTRNIITTVETYWLPENWTSSSSGESLLVGVVSYRTFSNGSILETLQSTVSDLTTAPFNWKAFDVADCLRNGKEQMIAFDLKVQNYTELELSMPAFEAGIRDALSSLTATSPLQFSDIRVTRGDAENELRVWMTVLDWVDKTISGTSVTMYQSAGEAVSALRNLFDDKDLPFTIPLVNRTQSVTFVKGSFQSGRELVQPTTTPITAPTSPTTIRTTETFTAALPAREQDSYLVVTINKVNRSDAGNAYNQAAGSFSDAASSRPMVFSFPLSKL
ncbi:uncharacterized protein LOC129594964 isoform X2 [Paramacrobiotus metropolitanus]|uniref:uncharacterized protein LOC129594964 isoform X2 n=1 Tax=Paramacrobiotus metropolitanus TaxID=2943436 RepID=UPI002446007D|nr:uncharacterized protein LOC129594964 isoform X2 [Paramacrobiotus metropolitanus]